MSEINKNLELIIKPSVERNIISICLNNPIKTIDVQNYGVKPHFFLIEANRYIYSAIEYLFHKQQVPTPFAIIEVLKDEHAKSIVEEFGGIEYLTILTELNTNKDSLGIFCEKLRQAYTRYKLYQINEATISEVLSDKMEVLNPSEIINILENQIIDLRLNVEQVKEIYKMGDYAEEIIELRAESPNTVPGLEVGWSKFDYYTNGGCAGDLIMLCARAKTGKSAMLTNWATNIGILNQIPVLYIDTEMNRREQEDRILARLSGVPHKEIVSGLYAIDTEFGQADEKRKHIANAIEQMKNGNYYHIYLPGFTMEQVYAIVQKFKIQNNIQAVFFDYLKFPANQISTLRSVAEWQMLGYIASGLKDLAGKMEIPIYAGCQENRSDPYGEKKDERNVGGSDRILQLATKLMFLNNKSEEQILKEGNLNGNQSLYIAFQRNGESDCPPINIAFNRNIMYQEEI